MTSRGFTLLELLVTVGLISLVMAFAAPSLADGLRVHAMTSGTRTAANYLRVVRATAIARGTQARLAIEDGTTLTTEVFDSGSWLRVGRGITFGGGVYVADVDPDSGIVFEREGTLSAPAGVTIANTRGDQRQVSVSLLGAIEVAS